MQDLNAKILKNATFHCILPYKTELDGIQNFHRFPECKFTLFQTEKREK
jgi:hypothetical protein